jgi:hypothetical protein
MTFVIRTAILSSVSRVTYDSRVSFECCHSLSCPSNITAFGPSTSPYLHRCLGVMFPSHLSIERVNPTLSSSRSLPPLERIHCHFLQLPSYRQPFTVAFYLSRDSLRDTGPFLLFASAGKTPHLSEVSETTLCSSFTSPSAVEATLHSSPFVHRHLYSLVLTFLAQGVFRLTQPLFSFVTVR